MKFKIHPPALLAALAFGGLLSVRPLHAAELDWDVNGTASGTGGTGTWDTTSLFWRIGTNGAPSGNPQAYDNTSPSLTNAFFTGTAGTVTLAAGALINVNTITVLTTTGYIINGPSDASITLNGTSPNTPPQITSPNIGTVTINAVLAGIAGFQKGGSDTLVLGGANTYTGATGIRGGILSISNIGTTGSTSSNLGAGTSTINFGIANPGTLLYTGSGESTTRVVNILAGGSIQNNGSGALNFTSNTTSTTTGTKSLTLSGSNGGTFSGNVVNGGGTVSFIKAGAGTWELSGANTYSGGTTVNAGNLRLTNTVSTSTTASGTGTGAITLSGGSTTTLSGTGNALGLLTATNSSRIAPGVNTSGTNGNFGVAGTLTLGTNFDASAANGLALTSANLDFDLSNSAGGTNDLIRTRGALTLGTVNFTFNELTSGTLDTANSYTLITGATSLSNTGAVLTGTVTNGDYTPNFSFSGTDLIVSFTPVPEPSTWAMPALLIPFALWWKRSHRRAAR